jgi:hypothetical protein
MIAKPLILVSAQLLAVLVLAKPAWSQTPCWTMSGTTGTVDEADLSLPLMANNVLQVSSTTLPADLDIRYTVTGIPEALPNVSYANTYLLRYRDSGSNARVVVALRAQNIISGATTTLWTFDSDLEPQSANFQIPGFITTCGGGGFDFENNVYFIEATLTRTTTGTSPALATLQICSYVCS